MKHCLFVILLNFIIGFSVFGQSYNLDWAYSIGSGHSVDHAEDVFCDKFGNVYVTGQFSDGFDFDPGPGVAGLSAIGSPNPRDAYTVKYKANGDFGWVIQTASLGWDNGSKVYADTKGNVYTLGIFEGTADLNPGAGIFNVSSKGTTDIYIQKLDSNGIFIWGGSIGGNGTGPSTQPKEGVSGLIVDENENIYIVGNYVDSIDLDPGSSVLFKGATGRDTDFFILKLDLNGDFVWAENFGSLNYDELKGIELDSSSNLLLTGRYGGQMDFDPGPGIHNLSPTSGTSAYVLKLDSMGNFIWVKSIHDAISNDIKIDQAQNIFLTGSFSDSVDFDPGSSQYIVGAQSSYDAFVLKLDAGGNFIWVKDIGSDYQGSNSVAGTDLSITSMNEVVVHGNFTGTIDFDVDTGYVYLVNQGGLFSAFSLGLDQSGVYKWVKHLRGGIYIPYAMSIDPFDNLLMAGFYRREMDADPGDGVHQLKTANNQAYAGYVVKIKPCNITSTTYISKTVCDTLKWIDGIIYSESVNQTRHAITNSAGCDSVIELKLTVDYSSGWTDYVEHCGSYTWIDGKTYWSPTQASWVLANSDGCDSTIHLDLTNGVNTKVYNHYDDSLFIYRQIGATYQWIKCLGNNNYEVLPNETEPIYGVKNSELYAVVVTYNGCTDTSQCKSRNIIPNGTSQNIDVTNFNIRPNPTTGFVILESVGFNSNITLDLFSASGNMIKSEKVKINEQYEYFVSGPPGMYFIRISSNQSISSHYKILKLKG